MIVVRLSNGAKMYGSDIISEAVTIATGDDGHKAAEVLRILEAIVENDLGGWA